jgi:hypothetical protein
VCKGSNTTSTSNAPNPQAGAAYSNLLNRAGNVANTPYQAYSGQLVAPINAQQQTGIGGINTNANYAQPFIGQAASYANQAAQPITAGQIQQYQNPFQQQVVGATEAQFNQQNAQQQSQLTGNAAAQGALGGDRVGVAQGTLAGQQQLAEAPVIAGLETQGYNTALQTALAEQQQMGNAAYSLGNLGVAGQNAALTGANAQVGAGTLEQQTQQAIDTSGYGQFAQAQAFPYQQTQWLAGLDTGVGSQMGGTGTTTGPAPNPLAQILGLGLAGASFIPKRHGGPVKGLDSGGGTGFGGTPYGFAEGYIPTMQITGGKGAPTPPGLPGQGQQPTLGQSVKEGQALGGLFKNSGLGSSYGGINYGLGDWGGGSGSDMASAASAGVDSGLTFDPSSGSVFRRGGGVRRPMVAGFGTGGMVRHYADGGGDDSFDDRFGGDSDFRPQPQRLQESLGLGDMALHGPPPDANAIGSNGLLVNPSAAWRANEEFAYPLSDIRLAGEEPGNPPNFGFDFNSSAYHPDPSNQIRVAGDEIPRPGDSAPALPPPRNVPDVRVAGLGSSPGGDSGEGYSGHALGYAPSPERGSRGTEGSEGSGGLLSKLGINMTPNLRQALLAAGLGMMASKSPFLGTAVGEGGLQGLATYSGAQKQDEATKKTEADIAHGRKQLEQQATIAQQRIKMESKKLDQQEEDRKENRALRLDLAQQGRIPPGYRMNNGQLEAIPGGPADPKQAQALATAKRPTIGGMSPEQAEIQARQIASGNMSPLTGLPRTPEGLAIRNGLRSQAAQIIMQEHPGMSPAQVAEHLNSAEQGFKGQQIGINSQARTAGVREANLNLILRATDAAIPAAIEASEKVARTGLVPLNRIIQKGEIMTSDPELVEFGMANLQLAEHWARAMNPTGVMRESDRDKALTFLDTGLSQGTYRRAVDQLQKQITRERDAVRGVDPRTPINPGAAAPEPGGGAAGAGAAAKPATVRQNGHTYQLQPDGNYKAVD